MRIILIICVISLVACSQAVIESYPEVTQRSHDLYALDNIQRFTYNVQVQQTNMGTRSEQQTYSVTSTNQGFTVTTQLHQPEETTIVTTLNQAYECTAVKQTLQQNTRERSCINQVLFPQQITHTQTSTAQTTFGTMQVDIYQDDTTTYKVAQSIPVPVKITHKTDLGITTYTLTDYR